MNLSTKLSEDFVSVRLSLEVIQEHETLNSGGIHEIIDKIPVSIAILNSKLQLVLANKSLLALLNLSHSMEIIGKTAGDVLGCTNAKVEGHVCGGSQCCAYCELKKCILASIQGILESKECSLRVEKVNSFGSLNVQTSASPLCIDGKHFIILCLTDIYHKKNLQLYERLFYHDILNTISGIHSLSQYLQSSIDEKFRDDVESLLEASRVLQDQIQAHREFISAESNQLELTLNEFGTQSILHEVAAFFAKHAQAARVELHIPDDSADLELLTDHGILHRCLVNLVKNAIEASNPGEAVRLYCRPSQLGAEFFVHNQYVIPESVQAQIFKRSFSTKGPGRGIGTHGVKLFVENFLNGKVNFSSKTAQGTCFRIDLPLRLHTL